mmetsp:Transcript_42755/g.89687  ORF Transcript_42755/g.89687 Transcript_42755/m.89687 type:complete len:132 (+) Transcript_42755:170-565(+)
MQCLFGGQCMPSQPLSNENHPLIFADHDVLQLNHFGNWGMQFGMLVEHLCNEFPASLSTDPPRTPTWEILLHCTRPQKRGLTLTRNSRLDHRKAWSSSRREMRRPWPRGNCCARRAGWNTKRYMTCSTSSG